MQVATLVDTTMCIGCRGCQLACKQWWGLPELETSFSPTMTNPPKTTAYAYVHVDFSEVVDEEGELSWDFVHKRCFHCLEPTCVSVCPVGAMKKIPDGPVVWDEARCIGCRYCVMACPFGMPKYQWNEAWPEVGKCWFCWDRLAEGLQPACAKACPPKAIEFGEREALLDEAHRRIENNPTKYVNYVYGEHEVGGTSLFYLAAVPFEDLGFDTTVPKEPLPEYSWEFLIKIPIEAVAIIVILASVWYGQGWFVRSREKIAANERVGKTSNDQ